MRRFLIFLISLLQVLPQSLPGQQLPFLPELFHLRAGSHCDPRGNKGQLAGPRRMWAAATPGTKAANDPVPAPDQNPDLHHSH